MKELYDKISKKITLYNVTLIALLLVLLIIAIYYLTMFVPRKIKINETKELNEEIYISNILRGKRITQIEVKILLNSENLHDYTNYVIGFRQGHYLNYQIILDNGNKKYEVKTMYKGTRGEEVTIIGYVYNSFFDKQDWKIGIMQKNYDKEHKEIIRYGIMKRVGEE